MEKKIINILQGYKLFRQKYAFSDQSVMQSLSFHGQKPSIMFIACCDSRVDPALILQCDPGDLFVVRNVANIVPPYEKDEAHHGTSAALEFGLRFLKIKNLILLGHSQCGGIETLLNKKKPRYNDFITNWVSIIKNPRVNINNKTNNLGAKVDNYAKLALKQSFANCLSFPWIKELVTKKQLIINLWFFDIKTGEIFTYSAKDNKYKILKL